VRQSRQKTVTVIKRGGGGHAEQKGRLKDCKGKRTASSRKKRDIVRCRGIAGNKGFTKEESDPHALKAGDTMKRRRQAAVKKKELEKGGPSSQRSVNEIGNKGEKKASARSSRGPTVFWEINGKEAGNF